MISIFGSSGFIGSRFISLYQDKCISIEKNINIPKSKDILYFISTTDNYNVYTDPYLDINTNLIKLISVLEECKKINEKTPVTFNFISSWFVYGKTNDFPAKETSRCNPTGFYSITKHTAEKLLISYCDTFNIKYRILRLTNIIGSNDKKISKKKNAIQYLIDKLKNNEDVELYNNGNVVRDYMFVDDCCRAINTCIERANYNEIINISNSEPVFIKDIIYYAKEKLKSSSKIISIETPEFHKNVQIENIYLDNTKLINLQYTPQTTVYQAIDKILET
jgi:nucleoside-diphosphate-sugar epimerase